MPFQQFSIEETEIEDIGTVTTVRFHGHHVSDLLQIQQLGEELYRLIEERQHRKLVLDFSHVVFFSSAAIGKLISLNGRLKACQGIMKLCNLTPEVLDVFRVCKLDTVFDIRQDKADALLSFES